MIRSTGYVRTVRPPLAPSWCEPWAQCFYDALVRRGRSPAIAAVHVERLRALHGRAPLVRSWWGSECVSMPAAVLNEARALGEPVLPVAADHQQPKG